MIVNIRYVNSTCRLTWSEGHTWCVDHGMEMLPLNTAGKVAAAKFAALGKYKKIWIEQALDREPIHFFELGKCRN